MMKLLWLIKIRSIHEDEFGKICVGSQVSWLKPKDKVIVFTWLPSLVFRLFLHQEDNRTLNSPVTNIKRGFWLILPDISCSKFRKKWSNSSLLWLGDWRLYILFYSWYQFSAQGIHLNLERTYGANSQMFFTISSFKLSRWSSYT